MWSKKINRDWVLSLVGFLLLGAPSQAQLPPNDIHIWQSSFIPPWITNAWTSAEWASDYQYMVNVRMDNEIWQWSVDDSPNKFQAWYSTTLPGYTQVCNCVGLALPQAQAEGIKVWLGLNINSRWFKNYANDPTWLDNEFTTSINLVQDLWNQYGATYGSIILGFYQPFEVDNLNEMSSTAQQRMIAEYLRLANYIHTNTGKQLIVSPFFNDKLSTPAQYATWWQTTVSQAPVDVIAMQDGIGVGHSTLTDVGSWFQAVCAGIHAGRAASQCWGNTETFAGTGGASNKPAPVSRVIQQLQAEQAYVDRFTDYTYEQLDTPLVGNTTGYNNWLNYVNTQP